VVRNRVLFGAAVAGLAVSLAGCQPVGYGYVAPVYADGYYGGYAVPVYAGDYYGGGYYGGYAVPVYAGGRRRLFRRRLSPRRLLPRPRRLLSRRLSSRRRLWRSLAPLGSPGHAAAQERLAGA